MNKLFVLVLASVPVFAAEKKKSPAPAPAPPAPATTPASTEHKPGFWERAWDSTKRVGKKTADVAKSPFKRGEKKSADAKAGWRNLAMSMTLDPAQVKIPTTRAVRVTVTVINKGKYPTQLDFPTTQRIEVLVKNEAGKVLSKWSDDQKVDKEQGFLVVNPGERLEYTATVSTREMSAGQNFRIEAYFPEFDQLRVNRTIMPVN